MKAATAFTIAMILSAPFAVAQKLNLQFDSIAAKAKEKAEVDLDGATLSLAGKADKKLGALASALKEVHVRHYEFGEAGKYSEQDLEPRGGGGQQALEGAVLPLVDQDGGRGQQAGNGELQHHRR